MPVFALCASRVLGMNINAMHRSFKTSSPFGVDLGVSNSCDGEVLANVLVQSPGLASGSWPIRACAGMLVALLCACGGGGGGSTGGGDPVSPPPATSPAPAFAVTYKFGAQPGDPRQSYGPPIQAIDGNFYGTTISGGANSCETYPFSCGAVYKLTPAGALSILHSFGSTPSDGWSPNPGLIEGLDGGLYGTTALGGDFGFGTIFRIATNGTFTVLYSFGASATDGKTPEGALLQTGDGSIYGTTVAGGAVDCGGYSNGCGSVFRLSLSGQMTTLHSFGSFPGDGARPYGSLVLALDGNFYGTTAAGGLSCRGSSEGCGTVFKMTPAGQLSVLRALGQTLSEGIAPLGTLLLARDGMLYGTTASGGENYCSNIYGCGTVFRITLAGEMTILHAFAASTSDGQGPAPGLMQARDGSLYGTTRSGGTYGNGTLFRYTPAGGLELLHSFNIMSSTDGGDPAGGVLQASDGTIYGTTFYAGDSLGGTPSGTVFTYRP